MDILNQSLTTKVNHGKYKAGFLQIEDLLKEEEINHYFLFNEFEDPHSFNQKIIEALEIHKDLTDILIYYSK